MSIQAITNQNGVKGYQIRIERKSQDTKLVDGDLGVRWGEICHMRVA